MHTMERNMHKVRLVGLLLVAASSGGPAWAAAPITSSMAVSASVAALCTMSAQPLAFGAYNSAQNDANTTINVTCTNGTTYSVGLDAGGGSGATTSARKMTGPGGATLNYNLFTNAARSTNWGNTVGTDAVAGTGAGVSQTLNVYGRIPANQFPSPGAYNDTVTITLTY